MTTDQWSAIKDHLRVRSRWYPWDPAPTLTMGEMRELVECFEDALATGDVVLCDEPPEARG